MEFEWDAKKSTANAQKHGIDFTTAQRLWDDDIRLEIPARKIDEPRTIVIGRIGKHCWAAVVTHRGHRIRLISVRRARKEEIALYESI